MRQFKKSTKLDNVLYDVRGIYRKQIGWKNAEPMS